MMKVQVCDAICGKGKTSSCINMMNSRTDTKFIFVTQFLSEVTRVKEACASRGFVSPCNTDKNGKKKKDVTKLAVIQELIAAGENIVTTHSLFTSYTEKTLEMIRDQGYVLVLDEVVDVMKQADVTRSDLDLLRNGGAIEEFDDRIEWTDDYAMYEGRFREEMLMARSKNFLMIDEECFYWAIPPELFTSFTEVYILSYMFHAQPLRCFFDSYGIEYELIGTRQVDGVYEFCPMEEMDRREDLRDKIHIIDTGKVNQIGSDRYALSYSWYKKARKEPGMPDLLRLKNNLSNVFKNVCKASVKEVMWTTYKDNIEVLSGKGYAGGFVPFNKRATNEFASRRYLAYCVNSFPRPLERRYFSERGVEIDGDPQALSTLVQWLFRSAIRNGEEVWIYIPSIRMRNLLIKWMDYLAEGRDLEPINYKTPRRSKATGAKRGRPPKCVTVKRKIEQERLERECTEQEQNNENIVA